MAPKFIALSFVASAIVAGQAFAQEDSRAADHRSRVAEQRAMERRSELGLDEQHSFKAKRHHTDELGQSHTRLDQYFNGVRVWGGEVIDHAYLDETRSGEATRPMTRAIFDRVELNVEPALGSSEALSIIHSERNIRSPYSMEPTVELVVYPETVEVPRPGVRAGQRLNAEDVTRKVTQYVLAYHIHTEIETEELTDHVDYLVNAHTGAILKQWSTLQTTPAKGRGYSQFSGTVTLDTNSTSSGFELRDMTRGTGGTFGNNVVTNLNHSTSGNGTIYTDADNTWGDGNNYTGSTTSTTGSTGQTAAVDAAYGIQTTWDMYKNVVGRNGIDGRGKATYARVHYNTSYDNAFWSGSCFCMTFGDGSSFKSLEALDVMAHEFGHGVNAYAANLQYANESGGLNEANSDLAGVIAEYYRAGGATGSTIPSTGGNWTMGEQLQTPSYNQPLRYMHKPSLDGISPNAWYSGIGSDPKFASQQFPNGGDPHLTCGPMNRCFYFLSQGATTSGDTSAPTYLPSGMRGIGPDKTFKIWYRALTTYLTSTSNYAAARTACINSAKDLYGAGSAEEIAVWNAFAGINVGKVWSGSTSTPTDPTPTTVSVSITPSSATVATYGTYSFRASVSGSTNTGVNWTATGGTVSSTGYYTAPATAGTYRVRATSAADSTKYAEATVTVTSSSTPQPSGSNLLKNGDFELGATVWGGTTGAISTWTQQPAYAGSKNAWLGGNGKTMTETLSQSVTIPSTATGSLSFYLHIDTAETTKLTAYDKLTVQLLSSTGTLLKTLATYSNLNPTSGYVQKVLDVSGYKGKAVKIQFKMTEDSSAQTSFALDNVVLK